MENILRELTEVSIKGSFLNATISSCEQHIPVLEDKIKSIDDTIDMITESREYLRKAIDIIYERSIGELENRLNVALNYIFYDKDLSLELRLDDKRGKSLQIILKDETGNEVSLRDGVGNGIRNVISFVLNSYYLLSKNSKVLLADEKYSNISAEYIPRFCDFAKKLCEATGLTVILITHDKRFDGLADKKLIVVNGEVREE